MAALNAATNAAAAAVPTVVPTAAALGKSTLTLTVLLGSAPIAAASLPGRAARLAASSSTPTLALTCVNVLSASRSFRLKPTTVGSALTLTVTAGNALRASRRFRLKLVTVGVALTLTSTVGSALSASLSALLKPETSGSALTLTGSRVRPSSFVLSAALNPVTSGTMSAWTFPTDAWLGEVTCAPHPYRSVRLNHGVAGWQRTLVFPQVLQVRLAFGGDHPFTGLRCDTGAAYRLRHLRFACAVAGQPHHDRRLPFDGVLNPGDAQVAAVPPPVPDRILRGEVGNLVVGQRVTDGGLCC